jgi:hypothetical protein
LKNSAGRATLSAMNKRSYVLLLLIGLLMVSPALAPMLLTYDPINSTGPGYLPAMAMAAMIPIVGVAVIAWGLVGLLRKGKP